MTNALNNKDESSHDKELSKHTPVMAQYVLILP